MPKPDHVSEECVSYESLPEDKLANAKQQGQAQFESVLEMVEELRKTEAAFEGRMTNEGALGHLYKPMEAARQRIHEDALSVEVRSDWHEPGISYCEPPIGEMRPAEYRILLCTGGPACQIVGQLDKHCEPETAVMQVQDWFQPWTEYRPAFAGAGEVAGEDLVGQGLETAWETAEDVLLAYARCFWFGE